METKKPIIKFKSTNTQDQVFQLEFISDKTVLQYKDDIANLLGVQSTNIKLVSKGKVLKDKDRAGQNGLKDTTVMMVLNKTKKVEKPQVPSSQQAIPRTNLSTGLGSSSPVGFGGYGIMNHPQYMSAISSAVDEEKVEQMMDDPYYQSMMEQMLDDPDTLKQLMEQNPMTKQLMEQNPMMKMIMSNPAMMKMVLNKDTIKMAKQMQKNGGVNPQNIQNMSSTGNFGGMTGLNGLGGFGGLGGLGNAASLPQNSNNNVVNPNLNNLNPGNMMGNPFMNMGMMGSGFGNNYGSNFPNQMGFSSFFNNSLLANSGLNSNQNNQQQSSSNSSQNQSASNLPSLFQNLQKMQQKIVDETKYQVQIKELNSMGFSDKDKCVKYLKQTEGDIDKALQKLCLDDDENSSQNKKV